MGQPNNETKYTPGPYSVEDRISSGQGCDINAVIPRMSNNQLRIATVVPWANCKDNAALFSAAPDMLTALETYMFLEQTNAGLNPHPVGTNRHKAFELGRAAIKKAHGQQ